uniref:Uncharacterized protein n=1 Tax=Trichobilharzia regenti TaxID=157069 RepID=A0AA85KD45_TRIRE|nr:unnamed protein product [Trichobilharzia regenti]
MPENPSVETAKRTTKPRVPPQTSTYLPRNKSNKQRVSLKNDKAWVTKHIPKDVTQHVRRNTPSRTRSNMPNNAHNLGMQRRMDPQDIWSTKRDSYRHHINENPRPNSRTIYIKPHQLNENRSALDPLNNFTHKRDVSQYAYGYESPMRYNYQGNLNSGYLGPANYNPNCRADHISPVDQRRCRPMDANSQNMQQDYFRLQQTIAPLAAQFIQEIVHTLTLSHLRAPPNIT